ncbi:YoaK family protein [Bacillus sp. 3255]|uniref:YoaK family protein n=1 Tax=Bacillus sp. 3255 TaxID=2817904 RepID=UPI00286C1B1A|nr:YoaK family protein [Bacillus sp. 3255]
MPTRTHLNRSVLVLCLIAGIVDVIGYLGLGHVFTANMTGNLVLIGIAIGQAKPLAVLRSILAFIGFIAGIALATVIVKRDREDQLWSRGATIALGIEGLLLFIAALLSYAGDSDRYLYILILLLSVGMGMQTTVARHLKVAGISTTVLTNNLANVIEDTIAHFRGVTPFTADAWLRTWAVAIYCLGAVITAILEPHALFASIWIPVGLLVGLVTMAAIRFR